MTNVTRWMRWAAMLATTAGAGGCAEARLERRVEALELQVAAIEAAIIDAGDDGGDAPVGQLVSNVPHRPSIDALAVARRRLAARLDAHRRNLANADVVGYRARRVGAGPDGEPVASISVESGPLRNTNRSLDLAINGHGFLRVARDGGAAQVCYTRAGNLFINRDGALVLGSQGGPRLVPPLTLPADTTEVNIAEDGTIEAVRGGAPTPTAVGRLELARFADPAALVPVGEAGTLFAETAESGPAIVGAPNDPGFGSIQQYFLESSNVDPATEDRALQRTQDALERVQSALDRVAR